MNTGTSLSGVLPFYLFINIYIYIFLIWTIFKVFIECVIVLVLFYVLIFGGLQGTWDLSSLTRGRTHTLCIGR